MTKAFQFKLMTERRTVRQVQTWITSASELIFMTEIFFALNKCQ